MLNICANKFIHVGTVLSHRLHLVISDWKIDVDFTVQPKMSTFRQLGYFYHILKVLSLNQFLSLMF